MKGFFDRLKGTKGSFFLLVGLAAGVLLLFAGGGEEKNSASPADTAGISVDATSDYISSLENRVTELISRMDGISDVRVVIIPESTGGRVYAENDRYSDGTMTEREVVIPGSDGAPITVKLRFPELRGVAVVCRGGANPVNQEKIVSLLTALFGLPATRVCVTG